MCAHRLTLDRRPRRRTLSRILAVTAAGALATSVVAVGQAPWAQAFLLVGYDDGGAVSVSNRKLGFQAGARPVDWWQP